MRLCLKGICALKGRSGFYAAMRDGGVERTWGKCAFCFAFFLYDNDNNDNNNPIRITSGHIGRHRNKEKPEVSGDLESVWLSHCHHLHIKYKWLHSRSRKMLTDRYRWAHVLGLAPPIPQEDVCCIENSAFKSNQAGGNKKRAHKSQASTRYICIFC